MTNNIEKRFHAHSAKLAAGARTTKRWDSCIIEAYISGIPDKKTALSLEWYCKRARKSTGNKVLNFVKGIHHWKFMNLLLKIHLKDLGLRPMVQEVLRYI